MNAAVRAFIRERAGRRCEYCRLHEDDAQYQVFHVEHVIAKQHGGSDDLDTRHERYDQSGRKSQVLIEELTN
jgi:hypothetical protein